MDKTSHALTMTLGGTPEPLLASLSGSMFEIPDTRSLAVFLPGAARAGHLWKAVPNLEHF
ncbi:MAG: hypothetical protein KGM96_10865 [Acidobacteriota bacterium]|nr:hypothetical protein [Acidobacteriota bacterium]